MKDVDLGKQAFFRAETIVSCAFKKWSLVSVIHAIVCVILMRICVNRTNVTVRATPVEGVDWLMIKP